ncbi:MAG: hypothetical protein IJJ74_12010 [Eubacterium sp.]|nr:hypothetical protein [Eubacterium sp.]
MEEMINKNDEKKSGKGKIVVGTILAVALAGNAALSIVTLNKLNDNNKKTEKVVQYMDNDIYTEKDNPGVSVMKNDQSDDAQAMNMNKDGIAQDGVDGQSDTAKSNPNDLALGDVLPGENDICIAGAYMIKSTENISDAYKSGDRSGLTDKEKETLDMAEKVIKEVIKPEMTDYEKEKAIYDWMTSHLANDSGMLSVIPTGMGDVDNPYGVLKYHNAVCVGYATTFRLFMHMLDIECRVVHNIDCHHSWDLVKLDGNWYHTDIYSDVGTNGYSHFNMNDEMMGTGQAWDRKTFPTADSLKYNILYREAIRPADIYQIPKDVRKAYDEHKGTVSFILNASDGEENCMKALKMVEEISDSFSMKYESSLYVMYNVVNVEEGYLLTVNMEWYIDGDDNYTDDNPLDDIISDEDIEKMENAVSDAFSDVLGDIDFD